ncbi:proton-translocating NADH-quinone oxidoreductase chain M [Cellulomonas sp. URHB0016]
MSSSFPWLTALIVLPLLGAVALWVLPSSLRGRTRAVALGITVAELLLAVGALVAFDRSSAQTYQLTETHGWIPAFGVSYAVGVDGVGLSLILMSVVLVPLVVLAGWREQGSASAATDRLRHYLALILVLEAFIVAVFSARDVFFFYVLFEAMLVPVYFMIGGFGGAQRRYAAVKFLLFGLAGGLIMLVAVIGLYLQGPGGPQGFLTENLTGLTIDPTLEKWLFLAFFLAFAIKAPMFPVHTWLPDAAEQAPVGTSTLLVGVLDKVGTFGMLTLCLPLFPSASRWAAPVIIVLALVSILYGALLAIGQKDLMRLIAYTSVSHFGFIVLGIFAFTSTSIAGSSFYMVNHGLSTGGAVPRGGLPGGPPRVAADRRLRRAAEGRTGAGRLLPGRRPLGAVAAGPLDVRQRDPRARRHVRPASRGVGRREPRCGARRDLRAVDVPAGVHRTGPRRARAGAGPGRAGEVGRRAAPGAHGGPRVPAGPRAGPRPAARAGHARAGRRDGRPGVRPVRGRE